MPPMPGDMLHAPGRFGTPDQLVMNAAVCRRHHLLPA
jgi:hypothetical protein